MKIVREIGITILIAVAIIAVIQASIQGYTVHYSCMLPNIEQGDWIMVSKASYLFSDPERGDVIVFWPPEDVASDRPFIKRVIALPGDIVEVKDGKVFINDIPIEEEYIKEPPRYTTSSELIPDGEYFVLGDNRNNSNDSHCWGTITHDDIIGKALFIYWPPEKWRLLKNFSYPELITAGA